MKILLLAGLLAAGAQAAGYRIAGTVVNAATQQPLAGVRVTIAPLDRPDERLPFVTGQDGRFVFAGMPPGKYGLLAQCRGFLTQSYNERAGLASAVVAGPGQHTDALVVPLDPPAVIAGRVTDDAGEPVEQALVQLFSSAIVNGRRRLTPLATRQTADTGEYRFPDLPPGTYFLAASGYPWYTSFNETHGDLPARALTHTGYALQYHRSTGDPAAAEPVVLSAGQEATADFALLPLPAASVHVHVADGGDSAKQYTLTAAGPGGNRVLVRQGSQVGDLYNFWSVPPGHYTLEVTASDDGRNLYAGEPVDVGTVDMDVSVTLAQAPSLRGAVELEGGGRPPANLSAVVSDLETGLSQSAPIGPDGRFSIPGIPPRHYSVALAGTEELYLKRWTAEGAGAAVRLRLVAARGTGRIGGTVERGGTPLPGALVVLAPSADPAKPEDCRALRTGTDGGYEFRGVPPGAYALFAVEDGGDLEYANPSAIRPYLASAAKLRVAPAGAYTQRLELPATAGRPASASPEP